MKGAMGIDGSKGEDFLNKGKDDGTKSQHDLSLKYGSEFLKATDPYTEPTWKPGKVSSGGKFHSTNGPPKGDATTKDVSAASPSGKYARSGGKGKGFA